MRRFGGYCRHFQRTNRRSDVCSGDFPKGLFVSDFFTGGLQQRHKLLDHACVARGGHRDLYGPGVARGRVRICGDGAAALYHPGVSRRRRRRWVYPRSVFHGGRRRGHQNSRTAQARPGGIGSGTDRRGLRMGERSAGRGRNAYDAALFRERVSGDPNRHRPGTARLDHNVGCPSVRAQVPGHLPHAR